MWRRANPRTPFSADNVDSSRTPDEPIPPTTHAATHAGNDAGIDDLHAPVNCQENVMSDEFPSVLITEGEANKYIVSRSFGTKHDAESAPEAHYLRDEKERVPEASAASQATSKGRSKRFMPLAIVIVVIVMVVVVVGTTSGILLRKKDPKNISSTHPPTTTASPSAPASTALTPYVQTLAKTSLASVQLEDGSGLLAVYYQAPNSSIVELLFQGTAASAGNFTPTEQSIIVSSGAVSGTPLTAVSYHLHNEPSIYVRQIFWTDASGHIWQSNRTGLSEVWQSSQPLTENYALPAIEVGTSGLVACVDPVNVFLTIFWSSDSGPQNMYMWAYSTLQIWIFSNQTWSDYDPLTEYACSVWNNKSSGVNFYLRNETTGTISRWIDAAENGTFILDPVPGPYVPTGTGLTANNNGAKKDFLFFEQSDGALGGATISETVYDPPYRTTTDPSEWANVTTTNTTSDTDLGVLGNASRMSGCWYTGGGDTGVVVGSYLFYQNDNATEIQILTTDAENNHFFNNTVQAVNQSLGV